MAVDRQTIEGRGRGAQGGQGEIGGGLLQGLQGVAGQLEGVIDQLQGILAQLRGEGEGQGGGQSKPGDNGGQDAKGKRDEG